MRYTCTYNVHAQKESEKEIECRVNDKIVTIKETVACYENNTSQTEKSWPDWTMAHEMESKRKVDR